MNKPQEGETIRYVVQHTHHPAKEDKPEAAPKPKADPRIGRAKRLLAEAELWEQKAKDAEEAVESHPLVDQIEESKLEVDWIDRECEQRSRLAQSRRQVALTTTNRAEMCREKAEQLTSDAKCLTLQAIELRHEADDLEQENRRVVSISKQDGPHKKLRDLEKRFNTETHRIAKKGREARKKAGKMRERLAKLLEEIKPLLEEEGE